MLTLLQVNWLSFFHWVMITSAKASIFIIFLLGVKFVLRHKVGARFQYGLWLILFIGLVLPWVPNSPANVYNYLDSSRLQQIVSIIARITQASPVNLANQPPGFDRITAEEGHSNQRIVSSETQREEDENTNSWPVSSFAYRLLAYLWLLGVLTLTVLTIGVNIRFSKNTGQALVTDPCLLAEYNNLKAELKIKREILLYKSRQINSPSLLGLIRPKLLLPVGIEQTFSIEQVNHIFLHELIHFKRRDIWINCLSQVLLICHWFNPLIWYAFYRMKEDQEISCDALVTARINRGQAQNYAYTLVKLAETYTTAPRMASLANVSGSNSQIKKRLIILSNRRYKQASLKWSLFAGLMIGVIALVVFSSTQGETNSALGQDVTISQGNSQGQAPAAVQGNDDTSPGITIEDITGPTYKGKVMLIKDSTRIKLAVTKGIGVQGEKVSELVKDMGGDCRN